MSQNDKGYASEIKEFAVKEARGVAVDDFLGAKEWNSSKFMWLTGLSAIATVIRGAFGLFSEAIGRIALLFRMAMGLFPSNDVALPTDSIDAKTRFEVAAQMYGRSDHDLRKGQENMYKYFMFYIVALVSLLGIATISFQLFPPENHIFFAILGRFFLVPVLISMAAKNSFYNWQFRNRKLGSFGEWAANPSEWWPEMPDSDSTSSGGKKGRKMTGGAVSALAIAIFASLLPNMAMAADGTIAEIDTILGAVPETDLWRLMLEMVFPGLGPLGGTGTPLTNGIAGAFEAFISVLMAVGALGLTYHSFVGMVNTAHQGKVLGDRWHQVWAPIRVSTGFGLLAPVVQGYGAAQLLAIQIALWGGALGNTVWYSFVDNLSNAPIQVSKLSETLPLVRDLALIEACYATLEMVQAERGETMETPYPGSPDVLNKAGQAANAVTQFVGFDTAAFSQYTWDYGFCGKISGDFFLGSNFMGQNNEEAAADLEQKKLEAFEVLRAQMREVGRTAARSVNPTGTPTTQAELAAAIESAFDAKLAFDSEVYNAAGTYVESFNSEGMDAFRQQAKEKGWASAAVFYLNLSNINAMTRSVIGNMPETSFNGTGQIQDATVLSRLTSDTAGVIPILTNAWDTQIKATTKMDIEASLNAGQVESNWFTDLLNSLTGPLLEWILSLIENDISNGSSLQHMVDFGHGILAIFWGLIILMFVSGSVVGKVTGLAGTLASKASSLVLPSMESLGMAASAILTLLALGLFAVGVIHAYVLPMIPFIQFTFFILGMLILAVEAVIAAPLWAFFHIRMDGNDFVDQVQKPGYMILFNMLLRIPLALMGLFFSILVFEAMMFFLNMTFYPAFRAASVGNVFGLIGIIVMLGMLTYLHYQIAVRSFQMVTQVPDRVSRWFGQGGENLGEDQETKQSTALVVGEVRTGVSGMAQRAGQAQSIGNSIKTAAADNSSQQNQSESQQDGESRLGKGAKTDAEGLKPKGHDSIKFSKK